MLTRSKKSKENDERKNHVSISALRNIINDDSLIDYLDLLKSKDKEIDRETLQMTNKSDINTNKKRKSSFDYIVKEGLHFEKNTIKEIKRRMKYNGDYKKIVDINDENKNIDKNLRYESTKNILLSQKPMVIFGAILYDDKRGIFGYPDIIVNGKFIKKYFSKRDSILEEINQGKKKKRKLNTNESINDDSEPVVSAINEQYVNNVGNYILENNINDNTYFIIDIKSSSLDLISGGKILSGSKNYNYYKFQTYSYNVCLNTLFKENNIENNSNIGFLMGRKYKARINKEDIYFKSFENLAIIKFDEDFSKECDLKCKQGRKWIINDLRFNYINFSLNPINKYELYPNMKNTFDSKYGSIKKAIAEKNKEITLLYYCGVDKRKHCHELGIKRLDDERLNSKILGFENKSYKTIIDGMLNLECSNEKIQINKEENNYKEWQKENEYEFFVDFETYSKANTTCADEDIIYMIGSYYKNEFRCFIINKDYNIKQCIKARNKFNKKHNINELSCNEDNYVLCYDEHDLITKFGEYVYSKNIQKEDKTVFKNTARLIHWSNFEERVFNSRVNKYYLGKKFKFNWYDLLEVFKYRISPIIIKGCRSFKLKEITNKMNEHNLIDIKWPDLEDGLLSSFMAKDIYERNDNKNKNNLIIDITEYNYVDCKSLSHILSFIRNC